MAGEPTLTGATEPAVARLVGPPAPRVYAGFWRRVAASLIDTLVLLAASFVVGWSVGFSPLYDGLTESEILLASNVLALVLQWAYFAGMHSSSEQATLGKLALGIRVTDRLGARIGFLHATARYFATILSALPMLAGFAAAGLTRDKRALHDVAAGTVVVRSGITAEQIAAAPAGKRWPAWATVLLILGSVTALATYEFSTRPLKDLRAAVRQVAEGLREAETYKDRVAAAIERGEAMPLETNLEPRSPYLESVEVIDDGVIVLVFGRDAARALAHSQLMIHPARSTGSRRVTWVCGYADVPRGFSVGKDSHADYTDVPEPYLPAHCRSRAAARSGF